MEAYKEGMVPIQKEMQSTISHMEEQINKLEEQANLLFTNEWNGEASDAYYEKLKELFTNYHMVFQELNDSMYYLDTLIYDKK